MPLRESASSARMVRLAVSFLPFFLMGGLICLFSTDTFTGDSVSALIDRNFVPNHVTESSPIPIGIILEKGNHFAAFLLLGLSGFAFKRRKTKSAFLHAFSACALVALGSEVLQAFTETRAPAVLDVALDMAAALCGLWLLYSAPAAARRLAGASGVFQRLIWWPVSRQQHSEKVPTEAAFVQRPSFAPLAARSLAPPHLWQASPRAWRKLSARGVTPLEIEIVQLLAEGKTDGQMAESLGISVETVESRRVELMHRLNVNSLADLVRFVLGSKIIEP